MLLKTYEAFQDRLEYTKAKNGSWRAEFNGRFHVRVEDPSLDRCRHRALSELDGHLAAWIGGRASKTEKKRNAKREKD